jgi:hypothetical protein
MRVDVQVEGLQHLQQVLTEAIPAKAQTKVIARALKRSARPMVNAARAGYQSIGGSGALAQATSAWQRKKGQLRGETFASVEVGPRRSNRASLRKYYEFYRKRVRPKTLIAGIRHGHLVEFGFTHTGGQRIAGRGILGTVMDRYGRQAVADFGAIMGEEIEREAERQARRQGASR